MSNTTTAAREIATYNELGNSMIANCTKNNILEHLEKTHDIVHRSPDALNGESGVFTEEQWAEMCSDSNHANWPTPIDGDFYTRDEYDRYISAGAAA